VNLLSYVETTIDQPAEKLWPFILHWHLWVDEKDYVEHRVSGNPDTEGEIKRITHFDETGRMDSCFFVEIVKIEPCKQLIYKILSPSYEYDATTGASSESPFSGYEVFDIHEKGGKTVLTLNIVAEWRLGGITEEEAKRLSCEYRANMQKNWNENYFPKLKSLVS